MSNGAWKLTGPHAWALRRLPATAILALAAYALHAQSAVPAGTVEHSLATDILTPDADHYGTVNVAMDSWIYPALERLAALGYIPSQNVSIRPWTRQECLRQLRQAQDVFGSSATDEPTDREAEPLINDLLRELNGDRGGLTLEAVYVRAGTIAGTALNDSFHFGQTWRDDYGRPFATGTGGIAGYSLRANSGRFFFHVRQEVQQVPGAPGITPAHSILYNQLDGTPAFGSGPPPPAFATVPPSAAYTRQTPLLLYAGVAFAGNALSFGKQELFWGPSSAPWSFSSNAEPTWNLRLNATRPHPFPFLPQLGTYKFDLVIGKLSGHKYPARPYFNGQKVDLTFGSNLELSVTRWSLLWGEGHPMTLGSLKSNLFSTQSTGVTYGYGERTDPGDRKSDFDLRLHVPGLRKQVTIYADAFADDDLNPIDAPRRCAWITGLYLPRLPLAPHMDFRFEMNSSEELSQDEGLARPLFINNQYRDANTNKGFLLGNAVGRDGRAFEGKLGYWQTARTRYEVGYRQTKISPLFLPVGGTISDAFGKASLHFRRDWTADVFVQHERWLIPVDTPGIHTNASARLTILWTPNRHL